VRKHLPFALLAPVQSSPRTNYHVYLEPPTEEELKYLWEESSGEPLAFDYETDGRMPHEGGRIVGVSFSDSRGSIYLPVPDHAYLAELLSCLASIPLVAHNLFFEMLWTKHVAPELALCYRACTYATYRHLANEGFIGQEYGLKAAEVDLLGWEEDNAGDLGKWLVENGHIASYSKEGGPGYYLTKDAKLARPRKEMMYLAPTEILGKYGAYDADATWQLWTMVLEPALCRFPALQDWVVQTYPSYIAILVEQYLRGVLIDTEFLADYREELGAKSLTLDGDLRRMFREQMDIYNKAVVAELEAKEPPRYKKSKPIPPEPPKYTKKGEITNRWLTWSHLNERGPSVEQSKNWEDWLAKWVWAMTTEHFNFNSGDQRAWLFYEQLNYPIKVRTDTNKPGTGEDALLGFGEGGRLLLDLIQNEKEISSIGSLEEKVGNGSRYFPQLKVPGTHTGRLAGAGAFNWQNLPKSPFMQAFVARPGYVLVSCDIAALEAVVLAERSRDPTLMKLYGPGAIKGVDIYLFNGSQLPIIGPKIRATGFSPDNMTKEATSIAKKEAKKERDISKVITLSANYGAGPRKIQETLVLSGVDITLEECRTIHGGFWDLYSGIKVWEKELTKQWKENRGWFYNGIGRPIMVAEDYIKDIVNRDCQSTGHDLFVLFLLETFKLRDRFTFYPWSADVHDCWYLEVKEEEAEAFCAAIREETIPNWNKLIGGTIELRAEPAIITNLWLDKAEGNALEKAKEYAEKQRARLTGANKERTKESQEKADRKDREGNSLFGDPSSNGYYVGN
jgi:DNA polymerase I-like protein with 3'-5' exonuclease and polymerase domains